ncbi:MAG: signal peptide peptidase SppA [Phycisphaerae bacterium]|nr:signal peptide peptidase SppA [Phycisphaerae bacterium]
MNTYIRSWTLGTLCLLILGGQASAQFEALRKFTQRQAPSKEIALFRLEGDMVETPSALPPLFGEKPPMSLKAVVAGLKEARINPNVVAAVIELQGAQLGAGQIAELHDAMRKFRAVDKPVYVNADAMDTLSYTLATGASRVSLVPTGDLWLMGLRAEAPYLRGTLDMLGIFPDFEHMGAYKSAAEMFTRTTASPEASDMRDWLLDSLYEGIINMIAEGRSMSPDKVRELINGAPYTAEEALEAGLIDAVEHRQDFAKYVERRHGSDTEIVAFGGPDSDELKMPDSLPGMIDFFMEIMNPTKKSHTGPSVAIVYVEGAIMTGEQELTPFGQSAGAFSTTIRKALDEAREDSSVKAVVLRVDSPGGSALASEIILDAATRVAARKPLIVSMGNVAGSGGYYVTCAARTIFADPTTITASIGVVGGKLVTTEAWRKIGVTWDNEQRGDMADMMSTAEKFSEKERARFIDYMETVYKTFKGHVVEARGEKLKKPIDEIAGGRVFTGKQALELGLIDRMGGLEEAISFAAGEAGISDYETRVIPEPPGIMELLLGSTEEPDLSQMGLGRLGAAMRGSSLESAIRGLSRLEPARWRSFLRALQQIALIQDEGVVMMMPQEFVIR